ncbi:MAG TPA: DUF4405 domain-containing protein [Candidatus Sulfotelmatobacter sp.]|jgi:hypothetical protein|nr:DUF4405 domain-containing protein [Candidatus Sulfotelmatobacter sp.]
MKFTMREIVTPAATGLFMIVAVSGVALFFHLEQNIFHTAHEWLGLFFVAIGGWHAARHWKSLAGYIGKRPSLSAFTVILAASILFTGLSAAPAVQGGPKSIIVALQKASLGDAAVAFGKSPDQAVALLKTQGVTADESQSVSEIAAASKLQPMNVLAMLASDRPPEERR